MTRREFIESHGATCRNWTWSWSFVNHSERRVIFGAWDRFEDRERSLILDEGWAVSGKGKRSPGYAQAVEHVRLVEDEGYGLMTFRMLFEQSGDDASPARIRGFEPVLQAKRLVKDGHAWYAV